MTTKLTRRVLIGLSLVLIYCLLGCEKFLPENYKEELKYSVSDMDEIACGYLSCDLEARDTVLVNGNPVARPRYKELTAIQLNNFVAQGMIADSDSVTINGIFDSLTTVTDTIISDTTLLVNFPKNSTTCYLLFNLPTAGTIYFYSSLIFDANNLHTYINADVLTRKAVKLAQPSAPQMDLETIAGCSEYVQLTGSATEMVLPKIRGLQIFDLQPGLYLVRFTPTEVTGLTKFLVTVLEER
jgi:hypothetical protein